MEKQLKILLVDNEAEFLDTITEWLETKEHRIQICYSGPEAIEIIKKTEPHMVFLDIRMPQMDGFEVLRQIRTFNPNLPVVIVTGYATEQNMRGALRLGVSGFFPKTGDIETLGRMIKAAIRAHRHLVSS